MTTLQNEHVDLIAGDHSGPLSAKSPDWLHDLRAHSLAHFQQIGLPTIKHEEWRYTNLRALKANKFELSSEAVRFSVDLPACSHPRAVFVNGYFREDLSDLSQLADGIRVSSLYAIVSDSAESEIAKLYSSTLPELEKQHGFTAMNTAYALDGCVITIDKNVVAKNIIEICYVSRNENEEQPSASHVRNLIVASPNSEATIIERHIGQNDEVYLSNVITEINAAPNAHIDHYKLQQESEKAFHFGGIYVNQAANSHVKNHTLSMTGLVTRNDLLCRLQGSGAHVEMNGLVIGNGRQHIDNHTEVEHAVAHCTSDEYYRAILDDRSRSVFRGRIVVAEDAQQTSADQQNNNLLLSANAEADCKPQLEIYADDVQCSHGATVGQLDSKSLFYLQSRGIDRDSARALLTFAFANEVIERINIESLRDELTQDIAGELLQGLEALV